MSATRLPHPHPFQPSWHNATPDRRIVRYVLDMPAIFAASSDEPGFLECMAVFGAALSLIEPAVIWGGF